MNILKERKISLVLIISQCILSMGAVGLLFYANNIYEVLSTRYFTYFIIATIFLLAYTIVSQLTDKSYIIGRTIASVFCLLLIFTSAFAIKASRKSEFIQPDKNSTSYIVLKEDKAMELADAKDYLFGVLENERITIDNETVTYTDMDRLIEGLYSGRVQVIVFKEEHRESVLRDHAIFEMDTRILK